MISKLLFRVKLVIAMMLNGLYIGFKDIFIIILEALYKEMCYVLVNEAIKRTSKKIYKLTH